MFFCYSQVIQGYLCRADNYYSILSCAWACSKLLLNWRKPGNSSLLRQKDTKEITTTRHKETRIITVIEKIHHKRRARKMWTKFFQSMASSYILFVQSILRDQDGKIRWQVMSWIVNSPIHFKSTLEITSLSWSLVCPA